MDKTLAVAPSKWLKPGPKKSVPVGAVVGPLAVAVVTVKVAAVVAIVKAVDTAMVAAAVATVMAVAVVVVVMAAVAVIVAGTVVTAVVAGVVTKAGEAFELTQVSKARHALHAVLSFVRYRPYFREARYSMRSAASWGVKVAISPSGIKEVGKGCSVWI